MARSKPPPDKFDTHVYLDIGLVERVKEIAAKESRSMSGQIEQFIRAGVANHDRQERRAGK